MAWGSRGAAVRTAAAVMPSTSKSPNTATVSPRATAWAKRFTAGSRPGSKSGSAWGEGSRKRKRAASCSLPTPRWARRRRIKGGKALLARPSATAVGRIRQRLLPRAILAAADLFDHEGQGRQQIAGQKAGLAQLAPHLLARAAVQVDAQGGGGGGRPSPG